MYYFLNPNGPIKYKKILIIMTLSYNHLHRANRSDSQDPIPRVTKLPLKCICQYNTYLSNMYSRQWYIFVPGNTPDNKRSLCPT